METQIKVTKKFIQEHSTTGHGGWNAKQMRVLGIEFPLPKGWLDRITGTYITKEQARLFEVYSTNNQTKKDVNQLSLTEQLKKGCNNNTVD